MANLNNLTFLFVTLVCLFTSGYCQEEEGSGSGGSGTDTMFTDVTEVVTEVVTDGDSDPSDIQAFNVAVDNDFSTFTLDVDNIVTYNVTIKNVGGTDIEASGSDLYDITIIVSDNADPTANGATTENITPLLTSATNLDAGIPAGGSIVIENVHTMINIASTDCLAFDGGYVCVQISKASGASYTDSSTSNNYYCLSFGDVADGYTGVLECSACMAKISIFALLLSTLLAYFISS